MTRYLRILVVVLGVGRAASAAEVITSSAAPCVAQKVAAYKMQQLNIDPIAHTVEVRLVGVQDDGTLIVDTAGAPLIVRQLLTGAEADAYLQVLNATDLSKTSIDTAVVQKALDSGTVAVDAVP